MRNLANSLWLAGRIHFHLIITTTYVPKDPSDFGAICNVLPRRADEVATVFIVPTSGYHCRVLRECVRRALRYKQLVTGTLPLEA